MRLLTIFLGLALLTAAQAANLKLIPTPQQVEMKPGTFNLRTASPMMLQKDLAFASGQVLEELHLAGFRPEVLSNLNVGISYTDKPIAELADKGPEAYSLLVEPQRIKIVGNSPAGTFYGVQTLKQLIRANRTGTTIPCCRILDWPGLKYRGYSDDISRGPIPNMDFFKREIRTMAEFKMNMLTFYTEHVFKLKKHPDIAPADGITPEQIAELSEYAKQYHVQLVGNFQSFGHFYNILKLPQYANLRETSGIICPVKEESYQFLDEVYSEIAPAYNSPLFNVNCDETQGLGEGPSKELAAKIGVGGVYLGHMKRIHDILKDKYGKRMMMWGDIALEHPDIVQGLPKDTILLSWGYGAAPNYDRAIEPFVKVGYEFMVCPGVSCWSAIFPNFENAMVNIQNYTRDGAKFGALGALNTTWDDDGENLFHWNFYGTNWGAACAWKPVDTKREDFDAAYAQVSYGTADDKVTRAIKLLASCVSNPLTQGNMDPAFWVRPFTVLATTYEAVIKQADALCATTGEAIDLLQGAKKDAKLDGEDLDYLIFAARRLQFIGRARQLQFVAAKQYGDALLAFPDTKPAEEALHRAFIGAAEMTKTVTDLRAEYQRLWLAENRPWWLDRMLGKYDGLLKDMQAQEKTLADASKTMEQTGVPPDPAAIGLKLAETGRRLNQAIPTADALLPANAKWWDERWPCRVPLKVQMADAAVCDYPVVVNVNFGEDKVATDAVRVIEYAADGTPTPLLTQYEPLQPNAGRVIFLLGGQTAGQAARSFAVYYDVEGSAAKPAQAASALTVTPEGDGFWVENERYRIYVGSQGAHLYEWVVKALDNTEITEPGRGSWTGFSDTMGDRESPFDLKVEASGPVLARIKATARTGSNEKIITFYAGKPYVEIMLARPVNFYWDYDNLANFAADRGKPGTSLFSNGEKQPVCASTEQVHGVGPDCHWGAKTRADGFVLANITPEVKVTHMTGPGDGWGGVGVEGGPETGHFVTFADKLEGDPAPVLNAIQQTFDLRWQPKLSIGKPERKP